MLILHNCKTITSLVLDELSVIHFYGCYCLKDLVECVYNG